MGPHPEPSLSGCVTLDRSLNPALLLFLLLLPAEQARPGCLAPDHTPRARPCLIYWVYNMHLLLRPLTSPPRPKSAEGSLLPDA